MRRALSFTLGPLTVLGLCACEGGSTRQTPGLGETSAPTPAKWEAEPTSYRGVAFGASLKQAKNHVGLGNCFRHEGRETVCSSDRKIADVSVHELWSFTSTGLANVNLIFDSSGYPALSEIFVEKYGRPTSVSHSPVHTLMGAQGENEIQTWKGGVVSIYLFRYGDKITEGLGTIQTNAYSDLVSKEAEERKKRAKDAL